MLADPILKNTSWTADRDISGMDGNIWLRAGETYHTPIEKIQTGVYEIDSFNFNLHIANIKKDTNYRLCLPDMNSKYTEKDVEHQIRGNMADRATEDNIRRWYAMPEYGVADSVKQILAAYPKTVEVADRQFCLSVTKVTKAEQPPHDGWRWHKWGEYIGTQNPQWEYLADEPDIDEVLVYHWYELCEKEDQQCT